MSLEIPNIARMLAAHKLLRNIGLKCSFRESRANFYTYKLRLSGKVFHESKNYEKFKEVWNGSNFKYWFIGGTLFTSWVAFYGLRNYKNNCLNIEIKPPEPNHSIIRRHNELDDLADILSPQGRFFGQTTKKLMIFGLPGSGKTTLINDYINIKKEKDSMKKFSLSKSVC